METKEKFQCPHCKSKLPFLFVVKIKNGHEFECPSCGETIMPEQTKSFLWGYVLGFLSFVVPAQVIIYMYDNIVLAFMVSTMSALTVIFLIALYVYSNTILTKST